MNAHRQAEIYGRWLQRFTFPNARFMVYVDDRDSVGPEHAVCYLRMEVHVTERDEATGLREPVKLPPGDKMVWTVTLDGCIVPFDLDELDFLDWARALVHAWMRHEADELILVDGARLYDPHAAGFKLPTAWVSL